jgi:hypothetical protein
MGNPLSNLTPFCVFFFVFIETKFDVCCVLFLRTYVVFFCTVTEGLSIVKRWYMYPRKENIPEI